MPKTLAISQPSMFAPVELTSAIVRDPLVVSPATTVLDAIARMSGTRSRCHSTQKDEVALDNLHREARSSCVLVVERDLVVGIFTERDVVRLSAGEYPLDRPMAEVMASPVLTRRESEFADLFFAINLLSRHRIRHLPLLDDRDRLAGLVTHETLRHTSRPLDLLRLRRVSEVMVREVVCTASDRSVLDIARLMSDRRVSSVILVKPGQPSPAPVGMLTERDLVQFQALGLPLQHYLAEAVMSAPVFTVPPEETLLTVQQMMSQHHIRRLVVTEETGELLGIVTQTSLLQALNPLELYKLAQTLETKVTNLEAEKVSLLENRAAELERQVAERTAALQAKAERERLLADLAAQIRSSLNLQAILETTVEQVRRVLGCDRVTIWQFEAEWCSVAVAESTDLPLSLMGERIHDTCFKQGMVEIYRRGNLRVVDDIDAIDMSECHRQMLVRLQTRAKILVPLLCGDELWGLLSVTESQPRHWQNEEVELLRSLSVQLAIALQQATTYQQLQTSERQLEQLNQELEERVQRRTAQLRDREVELKNLSERLELAVRSVSMGIWDWDIARDRLIWNDRMYELYDIDPSEFAGAVRGWEEKLHPEDAEYANNLLQQALRGEASFDPQFRVIHDDGSIHWIQAHALVQRDDRGQPQRAIGTNVDITELQQANQQRQQLIQELSDFKSALDESAIVAITDVNGIITYVNDRFCDISGYSREELIGETHRLVNSGYHSLAFFQEMWDTISSGEIWRGEICNRGKAENLYWVDSTVIPFLDPNGQPFQYLAIRVEITDRKQAEEAMKQQLAAMEAAINGIAILQDDNYIYLNQSHVELFGYDRPEELIGKSWHILYPTEEIKRFEREVFPILGRDGAWQGEAMAMRQDGSCFSEELSLTITENGLLICVCQDISDRKRTERKLQESEAKLQAILNSAPSIIYVKDLDGRHTFVNSAFLEFFNWSSDHILGKTNREIFPAEIAESFDDHDRDCLNKCQVGHYEETVEVGDRTLTFLSSKFPLLDRNNRPYALCGISTNISDRKQAEAKIALQLRQQQALGAIVQRIRESLDIDQILATATDRVKDILQSDRAIIFRLFPDGKSQIVEEAVSPHFPSLKDRHWEDEIWSQEILECYWQGKPRIVPDVTKDIWTDCLVEYSQEGQIQSKIVAPILQEVRISETHRWVAPGETNKLWGILVVHACQEQRVWQDSEAELLQQIANQLAIAIQQAYLFEQLQQELKERKQAQQQLTERNQQLAISNEEIMRSARLKDEFLANMSHELRTPLNAILGMTEGLQEQVFGNINQRQLKALQTIDRSGSHLLELINDILDLSKIESGHIELEIAPASTPILCKASLAFIKQQALKKNIAIEMQLPSDLPDLLVDERRIRQVLINLLNNAVKFTPEGGRITLEVSQLSETPQYLRIAIIDTGIGISPENIGKLFKPFVQIDSALNRKYAGTGLGLALVKRIVELHGGEVSLTSEVGLGSCFAIDLPCVTSTSSVDEPETLPTAMETPPTNASSPLILLAEDNEANIETIASYLEVKGYRLVVANNGQEAIDLTRSQHPDLILMDIQMPGTDGLEATREIRRDRGFDNVPIVALTALAMDNDRDRCLAAGANDYLSKPVKLKELAVLIQDLLSLRCEV